MPPSDFAVHTFRSRCVNPVGCRDDFVRSTCCVEHDRADCPAWKVDGTRTGASVVVGCTFHWYGVELKKKKKLSVGCRNYAGKLVGHASVVGAGAIVGRGAVDDSRAVATSSGVITAVTRATIGT